MRGVGSRNGSIGTHRAPRDRHPRRAISIAAAVALVAGVLVATNLDSATATQATGHDAPVWTNSSAWTYAQTFHYDDGNGTNVTINENVTYTNSGTTTFAGQSAYQITLAGTITGGSGNANAGGTNVSLSSFSGNVSGTEYIRRSDLAVLQEQQQQHLNAKADSLVGVTADVNLTLTPTPSWHSLDFPLNAGDTWQENENIAYTGGFSYNAGSFGSGSSPFDGSFPFVAPANVSSQTINAGGNSSLATDFVAAQSSDGSTVENQWWAPSFKNVAKEHLQVPLSGAVLTLDRTLSSATLPGTANSVSETITPSLTCAGASVTVAGTVSTNASGVPLTVNLDESQIGAGALTQNIATTTNGAYSATFTAPAAADLLSKNGARANWGVTVDVPSLGTGNVTTLVVSPQDCTSIAYTGATSGPQGGTATVSAKLTDLATAANAGGRTVTFALSGGATVSGVTNSAGVATATLPVAGPPRSATVTASVAAAADLQAATTTAAFTVTVDPTTTAVVSSEPSATIGDSLTFTATVTPGIGSNPTGTVQFVIDGANFGSPVAMSGGHATSAAISTLGLGTHSVVAIYSGDGNFAGSTSPSVNVLVHNPLLPTTTAEVVSPSTSVFGQSVTITATVAPKTGSGDPTGSVTFTDGADTIGTAAVTSTGSGDQASITVSDLAVGSHTVVATYSGDDTYNGSASGPSGLTVTPSATTTLVATDDPTTVSGQAVDVTATVSATAPGAGVPSGNVQLVVDGTATGPAAALSGGVATFPPLTSLGAGNHSVGVTYAGDGNFDGSTGSATQTVTRAGTTTSVTSTPSPSQEDQAVTITATVVASAPGSGSPTGTVTFTSDGDPIGAATVQPDGTASISVSTLPAGTHTIAASYSGDSNYQASDSVGISQTVLSGAATIPTTTSLVSSVDPSTYGQLITFTATVAGDGTAPVAGAVQFSVDGTNFGSPVPVDEHGVAVSPTLASPDPGDHTVIAAFQPQPGFAASGATITQTIADASVTVGLTSSHPTTTNGQAVAFTATVSSDQIGTGVPTGVVQFSVDGKPLGGAVALDHGTATSASISSLLPGSHTVTALYSGDVDFVADSATITQSVAQVSTTTSLAASAASVTYGQTVTFTATVVPGQASLGAPGGSVTFTDGSTPIATVPVVPNGSNGTATLVTTLGGGSHAVTATYSGSGSFTGSTSNTVTVSVSRAASNIKADAAIIKLTPPQYGAYGQLHVVLSSVNGPLAGQPVVFTIGGKTYCTITTDANGIATCNASNYTVQLLLAGGYVASFAGNANYLPSSAQGVILK